MKPKKVVFIEDSLEQSFSEMSDKEPLKKSLIKSIKEIKYNAFCGRNVKKKMIPKSFIDKYKLENLWICNLSSGWRLLYSLTRDEEEIKIIAIVLDWMDHKDYEKLFGFN